MNSVMKIIHLKNEINKTFSLYISQNPYIMVLAEYFKTAR